MSGHGSAGAVVVLHGSSGGLTDVGDHFWHQGFQSDTGRVEGSPDGGDWFGGSLAAGNFGKTEYDDLASILGTAEPGDAFGVEVAAG